MLIELKKIDLSIYKEFKQYFLFYDVVIKGEKSNKEEWLKENRLSPSSYRRAKEDGNKIGLDILKELNAKFSYQMVSNELLDEIERKVNEIYFNVYYKNTDMYKENMNWLDNKLKQQYAIYPILLLFKLLLIINSQNDPKRILKEYYVTYKEVKKYIDFFNADLLEIYEIINLSFKEEIDINVLAHNYNNELSYYALSSICILKGMYIESIYFAEKSKQYFIREENAKRIYYINLNLMSAYNYLGKFMDCNLLAQKQIIALESYKCYEFEYMSSKKHYMISCLGLGEYSNVIKLLEEKNGLNKTDYCCLFIAKYKLDKKEYNEYFSNLITSNSYTKDDINFLTLIYRFIVKKDKKLISEIEKHNITKSVIEIMKKM